jgi:hypothetical protein
MERIKELIDPTYVRKISFDKPLTEKEKQYIASLKPEQREKLKRKTTEMLKKSEESMSEFQIPRKIKVVTGEELKKLTKDIRNTKEYEKMLELVQKQKPPQLPEFKTQDNLSIDNDIDQILNSYGGSRRRSTKRRSTKRRSTKRRSTKRRSTKRRSTKRRSTKRRSTQRSSTKRRSTKRRSTQRRSTKRRSTRRNSKRRSTKRRSTQRNSKRRSTQRNSKRRSTKRRSTRRNSKRRSTQRRSKRQNVV